MADSKYSKWLDTATPNDMMKLLDHLRRSNPEAYRRAMSVVSDWTVRYFEAAAFLEAAKGIKAESKQVTSQE